MEFQTTSTEWLPLVPLPAKSAWEAGSEGCGGRVGLSNARASRPILFLFCHQVPYQVWCGREPIEVAMSLRAASAVALNASRGAPRCSAFLRRFNYNAASRRRMATSVEAAGSLPLEGYRVLDMTRVLAGVSPLKSLHE